MLVSPGFCWISTWVCFSTVTFRPSLHCKTVARLVARVPLSVFSCGDKKSHTLKCGTGMTVYASPAGRVT